MTIKRKKPCLINECLLCDKDTPAVLDKLNSAIASCFKPDETLLNKTA